jgi:hypothetical protein
MNSNGTPEIWETEEERSLSIGQLKYVYLQFAKRNFQGKVLVNTGTGIQIRVSQDGIMEWWRKSRKRSHIISVKLLDYFLENAVYKKTMPDKNHRKKIISASSFETECIVNGTHFQVFVTSRKAVNDIDKFRYFSLQDLSGDKKKP